MKRLSALLLALCLLAASCPARAMENAETRFAVQVPYATVKAVCDAGSRYLDDYGVTREAVLRELSAHEQDNYYLGTPYWGGDHQSPNGDPSYNGLPGMNCAGFPGYVLRKCGLDAAAAMADMSKTKGSLLFGSKLPYDLLSGASNYFELVKNGRLTAKAFPSKAALLASGQAEKGDLLLRYYTNQFSLGSDEDNHLMFFWGDRPDEDKVWHSTGRVNNISAIMGDTRASFVLIKFAPEQKEPEPEPEPEPELPPAAGFRDVHEGQWFAGDVVYVKEKGLMVGVEETRFDPEGSVTRAQIVSMLYRLTGSPYVEESSGFSDVAAEDWFGPAVCWAEESGVVSGYADGRFGPKDQIRREDLAVFFYRYYQNLWNDPPGSPQRLAAYADADRISGYAVHAMTWAVETGMLSGTSDGRLSPDGTATRAQAASLLARFCRAYVYPQGEDE